MKENVDNEICSSDKNSWEEDSLSRNFENFESLSSFIRASSCGYDAVLR